MKYWVNFGDGTGAYVLAKVLQRVEEGMSTTADAEYLHALIGNLGRESDRLSQKNEKLAAKSEKGPFEPKSAS